MWQVWITLLIGLWMVLSGLVPGLDASGNYIVTGAILTIFGFWAGRWQGTINGLLGLWIVLSGIVPSLIAPGNLIVVGIVVTVLAIWQRAGGVEEPVPQTY